MGTLAVERVTAQILREKNQWILWWPVGMGLGIMLYFSLAIEPAWYASWILLAVSSISVVGYRSDPLCLTLQLALLSVVIGFALIDWRVDRIAAPRLESPIYNTTVTGRVDNVELQPSGYRLLLSDLASNVWTPDPTPLLLRIKRQTSQPPPQIGARVSVRANLWPPGGPVIPIGAYDFQRYAFFQQLGGTGIALDDPILLEDSQTPPVTSFQKFIGTLRSSLKNHHHSNPEPFLSRSRDRHPYDR